MEEPTRTFAFQGATRARMQCQFQRVLNAE